MLVGKGGIARTDGVSFNEEELRFLTQCRIARVATSSRDGQPHIVPVAYEFDGKEFYFTGRNLRKSQKFKNLEENSKVALVVDDVVTVCPWRLRWIEVRGRAELCEEGGRPYVKIVPTIKRSSGF